MESERSSVKISSITKEAKAFNAIAINSTVQGMKTASLMDRTIREAEKIREEESRNSTTQEATIIPTGAEIREAYEEGEYR